MPSKISSEQEKKALDLEKQLETKLGYPDREHAENEEEHHSSVSRQQLLSTLFQALGADPEPAREEPEKREGRTRTLSSLQESSYVRCMELEGPKIDKEKYDEFLKYEKDL